MSFFSHPLIIEDLDYLNQILPFDVSILRNECVFITGGTGVIGKWLVSCLIYLNDLYDLNLKIIILSRSPMRAFELFPELFSHSAIEFKLGDIKSFDFENLPEVFFVIHGATSVIDQSSGEHLDVCYEGAKKIKEMSEKYNVKGLVHLSSGAVYGESSYMSESALMEDHYHPIFKSDIKTDYAIGKRVAEHIISGSRCRVINARLFAVAGPFVPEESHFAIFNFIDDALKHRPIHLNSNGNSYRSYIYWIDLVARIFGLLVNGTGGRAYNIGSSQGVSILDLAKLISSVCKTEYNLPPSSTTHTDPKPKFYVPDINLVERELETSSPLGLVEVVKRLVALRRAGCGRW